ncbi:MAG: hypothetical protein IKK38_04900, partial [Spirochaetaceae bacterium]|nr:hypothetical protein [Spirochaetaceae bacterium]
MDQTENKPKKSKFGASTLIFAVIIVLVLALAGTTMFKVDDTEQAVITRFGKYYKTVGAGLHL